MINSSRARSDVVLLTFYFYWSERHIEGDHQGNCAFGGEIQLLRSTVSGRRSVFSIHICMFLMLEKVLEPWRSLTTRLSFWMLPPIQTLQFRFLTPMRRDITRW